MSSIRSRGNGKDVDSPPTIEISKSTAVWKRIVAWYVSNFPLVVPLSLWTLLSQGFKPLLDPKYYLLSVSLYTLFSVVSFVKLLGEKSLFGSSRLRITPGLELSKTILFYCVAGLLLAKCILLSVNKSIANWSRDDISFHPKEDIVPFMVTILSLWMVDRLSLPISLRDSKTAVPPRMKIVQKNGMRAGKIGVLIAIGVLLMKFIGNFIVGIVLQWRCPTVDACAHRSIIESNLPIGSVGSILCSSFALSFVVIFVQLTLRDSQEEIFFHPIDFTKLVHTTSKGLRGLFVLSTEAEDRSPTKYVNELELLMTLTTGLVLPADPIFPWQVVVAPTNLAVSGGGGVTRNQSTSSLRSVASSVSTRSSSSLGLKSSVVEGSNKRIVTVDRQGQPVSIQDPFWRVALDVQAQQVLTLASTGSYNVLDPVCLPYWGEVDNASQGLRAPTHLELLWRSLAMQDLHRVALSSKIRRQTLFHQHWSVVVVLLCSVLDAMSLQLQFVDNYMKEDQEKNVDIQTNSRRRSANSDGWSETIQKFTTSTSADGQVVQFSPFMEALQFIDNLQDVYKRVSSPVSWLYGARYLREACGWTIKNRQGEYHKSIIPPLMSQYVVHAVESVTLLLIAALTEDSTGLVYHNVPCVVNCLLRLDHALKAYSLTVHQAYSSQFHKQGKLQRIQYRVKSLAHLPEGVQGICVAVDDALKDLAESYYDVLKSCDFVDPLYSNALKTLLSEAKK